jgi:protein-tyrosine-phosphatase
MAEALLRAQGPERVEAQSAGANPAQDIHPRALQVLAERGIPVVGQRAKRTDEVLGLGWDVVITVCDQAREACPVLPGATLAVHWGMEDPAEAASERAFAEAFELLSRRVDELLALPLNTLMPDELLEELEGIGEPRLSSEANTAA